MGLQPHLEQGDLPQGVGPEVGVGAGVGVGVGVAAASAGFGASGGTGFITLGSGSSSGLVMTGAECAFGISCSSVFAGARVPAGQRST